jgi:hypothetical protein
MDSYKHIILACKILIGLILGFIAFRNVITPVAYGEYDLFWKRAVNYWNTQIPMEHVGVSTCQEPGCHVIESDLWASSKHRDISCESCHSPPASREKPEPIDCLTCHQKLMARPTNFPQVQEPEHYPEDRCLKCHDPHAPIPMMRHPMPVGRQERQACMHCHLKPVDGLSQIPVEETTRFLDRLLQAPRIAFDHGGKTYCVSCHTPSPSLSEMATMVHGKDFVYCPKCHREGGLAGGDFR